MVDETEAGKGRRTPTRKEAEAARKKQMKVPVTRKDQAKRERAAREELRLKQREALKTGDEKYLPLRERGPVRKFCRDYVDRRWNFAEFLLPFLARAHHQHLRRRSVGRRVPRPCCTRSYLRRRSSTSSSCARAQEAAQEAVLTRRDPRRDVAYAVLRSTQLRRFRLPKPQVKRGEPLADRY